MEIKQNVNRMDHKEEGDEEMILEKGEMFFFCWWDDGSPRKVFVFWSTETTNIAKTGDSGRGEEKLQINKTKTSLHNSLPRRLTFWPVLVVVVLDSKGISTRTLNSNHLEWYYAGGFALPRLRKREIGRQNNRKSINPQRNLWSPDHDQQSREEARYKRSAEENTVVKGTTAKDQEQKKLKILSSLLWRFVRGFKVLTLYKRTVGHGRYNSEFTIRYNLMPFRDPLRVRSLIWIFSIRKTPRWIWK